MLVIGLVPLLLLLLVRVLSDRALRDSPFVPLVVAALEVVCAIVTDPTYKPIRQLNIYFFARAVLNTLGGFLPAVRRSV